MGAKDRTVLKDFDDFYFQSTQVYIIRYIYCMFVSDGVLLGKDNSWLWIILSAKSRREWSTYCW